ncbi:MAG: type II secretion system GspH family protein [Candidatus Curtissbacteria bacterium]|nr:type II secretion system GspH family protein [Candidatus Curtissbacteria bacterium]
MILPKYRNAQGFTLIELLVVIGILAILLAIVLVAINPARQFSQANNTQRKSDVNAILNAIHQYAVDNNGNTSALGIDGTVRTITSTVGATNVNLCEANELVPTYIADLPLDPQDGTEDPARSVCTDVGATYNTGYTVVVSATDNRVTVAAPGAELSEIITVTR